MCRYLSGGYYVARLAPRPAYMSPELVPDRVLSASGCICEFFPDDWAIEWASCGAEARLAAADAFGISPRELPAVMAWATNAFSDVFGWPNAFYSLEAAQHARAKLLPASPYTAIFGLGLHESHVGAFLSAAAAPDQAAGFAPRGDTGVFECMSAGESIAPGGERAGFELLAVDSGLLTCSWLCNGLERTCARELGVFTNRRGFVESYDEALRCAEFISRPETGAEPGLWLPWLVTIYSRGEPAG